ncbi:MFS transporter [Ornithinimicrobium cerasi]|uniref:MFS transporter n=1 Tax=Ornithinimicrobium cerasi TaxID=2248773 RepID=UPI001379DF6F|nr:MFS transporter [Ornithinimicrobium cerasi]
MLALQTLAVQVVWVGVRVLGGLLAVERGAGVAELGLLAAVTAAPALVGAVLVGRLCDRVGGAAVAAAGVAVLLAGTVVVATAPDFRQLLVGSAVSGAGGLLAMLGQQAIVAARSKVEHRTGHYSTVTTAASVGQLLAPLLVTGGAAGAGMDAGLLACFGTGCLGLVVAIVAVGVPEDHGTRTDSVRLSIPAHRVLRMPGVWRSVGTSAAVLVTVDLLYTMLPLWAAERDVPTAVLGALLALRAGVSVLSRLGLARVVHRIGVRLVLTGALALGVTALVLLAVAPTWAGWIALTLLGVALGAPQPITMAWTIGLVPSTMHGAALGLRLWANRTAQVVLPMTAGALIAPAGFPGFALINAGLLAGACYLVSTANFPRGQLPEWES